MLLEFDWYSYFPITTIRDWNRSLDRRDHGNQAKSLQTLRTVVAIMLIVENCWTVKKSFTINTINTKY